MSRLYIKMKRHPGVRRRFVISRKILIKINQSFFNDENPAYQGIIASSRSAFSVFSSKVLSQLLYRMCFPLE
mgnify:CR=1 FL=1